jgi:ubiquinone biosynthesis protein
MRSEAAAISPAHALEGAPAGEVARLAAIARVAAAKGWGHYAEQLGFGRHEAAASAAPRTDAVRLREALEELGPTFVKFGQMMSQRDDVFPPALAAELRSLQDRAGAFPGERARRIIEEDTGRELSAMFRTFDDQPIAAASMAQIHCATLHDGTPVIVKVQRPGIEHTVEGDIAVLRRLVRLAAAVMPSLRAFNLPELVDEFAVTLRAELDFEHEAHNAERFAELNREEPTVLVPRIYWHATTRRVLTMDHSPGRRVDEAAGTAQGPAIAQTLMRLFLTQVFEHGVFHADPHPGNIFLLPDGRLCFHDFGAIGELSPRVQESLRQLFLAVMARDAAWVASAYLGMGGATRELDRGAFTKDLSQALDRYYRESSLGRQSFGAILEEFIGLGRHHHIRLLRETTMLMRAFAELESLVRRLDPDFSSLGAFQGFSGQLLKHAFLPHMGVSQAAKAYRMMSTAREVASEAPVTLRRLMGRLERGEPLFDVRHHSGGSLERHLLHASNRLAFALIVAAIVVGSSILLSTHAGPHWEGLPLLGIAAFVIAAVLGIVWAVLALKSGKL